MRVLLLRYGPRWLLRWFEERDVRRAERLARELGGG